MKNIVILVRNYEPYNSAIGICMKNIAECLKDKNKISVICEKVMFEEEKEEIVQGEYIFRFLSNQSRLRKRFEQGYKYTYGIKKLIYKLSYQIVRAFYNLKFLVSRESVQKNLIDCYLKALNNINGKIDIILPTCMPVESIIAAQKYCEIHPESCYIPILFDKFAANGTLHRTKLNKKLKMKNNIAIEKHIFEDRACRQILFVPSWKEHIKHYHFKNINKFIEIEHPLVKKIKVKEITDYSPEDINIVYTGAITISGRNPEPALDLFMSIFSVIHNIVIHIYGAGDALSQIKKRERQYGKNIRCYGKVSSDDAHSAMLGADMLLSLGNSDITQTPSKIFEYMSCGKPIIHFALNRADPVLEILKRYPISYCISLDDVIKPEALESLCFFIENSKDKEVDFEIVKERFKTALPEYSANIVLES